MERRTVYIKIYKTLKTVVSEKQVALNVFITEERKQRNLFIFKNYKNNKIKFKKIRKDKS